MKVLEVFAENNEDSRQLLSYLTKHAIKHKLFFDKKLVKEVKKELKRECPIVFLYDHEENTRQVITSLQEIKEYING
tara:strand:+ start:2330 stop:2560 length:231 start_codon:yes stop_codon:yes gene_type:complete